MPTSMEDPYWSRLGRVLTVLELLILLFLLWTNHL